MNNAKTMMEKQRDAAYAEMNAWAAQVNELEHKINALVSKNGFESWVGFNFHSSSGLTDEFEAFSSEFRAHIKKILPEGASLAAWNRGHFDCSGFIERSGKFVYFSTNDVRGNDDWFDNLLIRTAKNLKDYTGGHNNFTSLAEFKLKVSKLLEVPA